jgi:hypothetical protein
MLRISLSRALPPRPHQPSPEALNRVFGGSGVCTHTGSACTADKDCCSNSCSNGVCA